MPAPEKGKYRNNMALLHKEMQDRLAATLDDGIDPWGQGAGIAQQLDDIRAVYRLMRNRASAAGQPMGDYTPPPVAPERPGLLARLFGRGK